MDVTRPFFKGPLLLSITDSIRISCFTIFTKCCRCIYKSFMHDTFDLTLRLRILRYALHIHMYFRLEVVDSCLLLDVDKIVVLKIFWKTLVLSS